MVVYDVPFYENTPDNTHCFQASLKMILEYFQPKKDYSFEYLDTMSAKVEGKWTWPMAALLWCAKQGLEIKNIEVFDYNQFIQKGESYLFDAYGKEVAEAQIKHSNIPQEIEWSKKFTKEIQTEVRLPDIQEIKTLLDKGYLLICNVNSHVLSFKEGYSGHSVVIKGYGEDHLIINDPGLPGIKDRLVSFDLFEKSWAYPHEKAKNIMAFKATI